MADSSLSIPLTALASRGDSNENDALIVSRNSDNTYGEATRAMNGVDIGLTDFDEDDVMVEMNPRTNPERRNNPEGRESPDEGLDPGLTDVEPSGDGEKPEDVEPRHKPPIENGGKFPQHPFHGYPQPHGVYAVKKNIAQGMMDVALLTANASQLRYVLRSEAYDVYYYISVVLISISIVLQVIVGFALVMNNYAEQSGADRVKRAKRINNIALALIFLITVVNIFIASFGVEDVHKVKFSPQKDCRDDQEIL